MALFKNLKLVKDAMSPAAIKQGLEASRAAMSGSVTEPTEEQLAAMPADQRAAYEAAMAQVAEAESEAAAAHQEFFDREMTRRALYGPAGEYVYGPPPPARVDAVTLEDSLAASKEQFKDVLRNPLGSRKPSPPPGAPTGPVDRDQQAAAERTARDAARQPYLAPNRPALTFARLATRDKTQVEEVAAYLGSSGLSARPNLVFGVYRVPDHIGGGLLLRGGSRVVEWDVVHAATADLGQGPPAVAPVFDADEVWVRRGEGEPAPLDEDLALSYLARAGIGPEGCLGIARFLKIRQHNTGSGDEGGTSRVFSQVTGVSVFHPAAFGSGVFESLRAERPLAAGPMDGVRVDALNWRAIARAVRPETHRRYVVPSPFPYLPSTPQELLRAYLEIVGVRTEDSYGVQVTEDDPHDITGVSRKGLMTLSTNTSEEQPCADGELRPRLTGGARVVVVYRDRPEYEDGRDRWAAYERDVLQAALSHGTNLRPPVVGPGVLERGALGKLVRGADHIHDFVEGIDSGPEFPPYRYCWPPAG